MHCELPVDHMVGGIHMEKVKSQVHLGRNRIGQWRTWPMEKDEV